jgi:molybdate transport system substrate-binding protein
VRRHLALPLALLASLTLVGSACGSSNDTTAASPLTTATGTITVSAAASLTEPFKKIGDDFEKADPGVEVTFTFDSSGTLATQIRSGAPADVFASADDANMKKLTDAGLISGSPARFARNKLAIVVKKGNPRNIKALADLPGAGTISLCGPDVPCGRYADQILETAGVAIPEDEVTRGQNVKATLTAVADGDADAGIVYVTDVTGDKVESVAIPDAQNAIADYPIGVVGATKNEAAAQAFVAYVTSPAGQAVLKAAGFQPPS